jgi:hypothetical protein
MINLDAKMLENVFLFLCVMLPIGLLLWGMVIILAIALIQHWKDD